MKFCPLVPVCLLNKLAKPSRAHMVLAQHCELAEYFEFYRKMVERGDLVILDNGAYEEKAMGSSELLKVTEALRPTTVVAPDVPGNYNDTKFRSLDFLQRLRSSRAKNVQCMKVLHAADGAFDNFVLDYKESIKLYEWIGFSRLTQSYLTTQVDIGLTSRRYWCASELIARKLWDDQIFHHALGMLNGSVAELHVLNRLGFTSCDSSAPVWRGLHSKKLNEAWSDYPFRVEAIGFSNFEKNLAALNLQEVQKACRGKSR